MNATEFNDRFERTFFSRIPREVAESFTDEQLTAIKTVFGGETWDEHPVDVRGSVRMPFRRWYFVLIAGPDKRSPKRRRSSRRQRPIRRALGAATTTITVVWLVLLVLYLLVPADLLPQF